MSETTSKKASVIAFAGGRLLTMDPKMGNAEVIVIKDDRIVDVGDKNLLGSYPDAEIVDLKGRIMIPGFIDSHNHLSFACFVPVWADLNGLSDKAAILRAIKKHSEDHPGYGWIVGFPWLDADDGGVALTNKDLDSACIDRPVLLIHGTFHKAVVNTKALEMAGINKHSPELPNGKIIRDDQGEPNGMLLENAVIPLFKLAIKADTSEFADLIEARAKKFFAYGITAIQDPGVIPEAESAYRLLHAGGRLPVSVLMMPHGVTLLNNRLGSRLDGPVTGAGDEWLRVGPIKLFADGGTTASTALAGKIAGRMYTFGVPRDDFEDVMIEATKRGFRVCVHCLGNMAVEAAIGAFEGAARKAPAGFEMRPRLEHMMIVSDDQVMRLASMGGCAGLQAFFLPRVQKYKEVSFEGYKWVAYADIAKGGVTVAAGSDDPGFGSMGWIDPLKCSVLGASMSHENGGILTPEQSLSFEQWLWMYTAGAAYAGGLENERGMLKKGLVADLVILDGDPGHKNPPVVAETWKAGRRVYSHQDGQQESIICNSQP